MSKRSVALSATLAGVLATGLVPAFALADEAAATESPEINTLAASKAESLANGTINYTPQGQTTFTLNADGNGVGPSLVSVTPQGISMGTYTLKDLADNKSALSGAW